MGIARHPKKLALRTNTADTSLVIYLRRFAYIRACFIFINHPPPAVPHRENTKMKGQRVEKELNMY